MRRGGGCGLSRFECAFVLDALQAAVEIERMQDAGVVAGNDQCKTADFGHQKIELKINLPVEQIGLQVQLLVQGVELQLELLVQSVELQLDGLESQIHLLLKGSDAGVQSLEVRGDQVLQELANILNGPHLDSSVLAIVFPRRFAQSMLALSGMA
jgi:hypothetical protein